MKTIDNILLQNSIRLLIGGALFDESIVIEEVPSILKDLAEDYVIEIEKNSNPL